MVTIKDVAKEAHVSVTTVSRVINNTGYVNVETRNLVIEAIKKLNYAPNQLARSFFRRNSKIIGLILPNLHTTFYNQLIEGIEEAINESGYRLMICLLQDSIDREKKYLKTFSQYNIDGLILAANTPNRHLYDNYDIPTISIDHYLNDETIVVTSDNVSGGILAAKKLIESGCNNLLHFHDDIDLITISGRTEGFLKYATDQGKDVQVCEVYNTPRDFKLISDFLQKQSVYDGIFCSNDNIAFNVINVLHSLGKKVPDDVQVVGFDNLEFSKTFIPSLTTISQPIFNMGKSSVNILINIIEEKETLKSNRILPVKLIERDTTKNNNF